MGMRTRTPIMRKLVQEATRCELCFATRHLEAHHIIPLAFGGEDIEDNIIVICEGCHAKLTPKSLLAKQGLKKVKENNARILSGTIMLEKFALAFYERIQTEAEGGGLGLGEVLDIFDEEVAKFEKY